ncbi:MAG: response regulator [Gemmatimonadota bacterium]|nr:response regulator [Gemmatimonadota bacterium]MDH3422159.1 response regulator [Gemmatimonadota bacterium]
MRSPPVVLVVEDNSELRHVLKEALGAEGYHVLTTRDASEALELLRGTHVDLFISDLTDPKDASEALQAVRREFPKVPVVALAEAGHHPSFFFAGWQNPRGYLMLPKPFRLGELLALSREVLGPAAGTHQAR